MGMGGEKLSSIPINTIFNGMNIHFNPAMTWGSLGTRVLTHPHIITEAEKMFIFFHANVNHDTIQIVSQHQAAVQSIGRDLGGTLVGFSRVPLNSEPYALIRFDKV